MELPKNHTMSAEEIVNMIMGKRAEGIARGHENSRLNNRPRDPWNNGDTTSKPIWQRLDRVYTWTLANDTSSQQAYRRLGDDVWRYSNKHVNTWRMVLDWTLEFGDPNRNDEWLQWQDLYATARY